LHRIQIGQREEAIVVTGMVWVMVIMSATPVPIGTFSTLNACVAAVGATEHVPRGTNSPVIFCIPVEKPFKG
jgi:hypothetical protein